jgi:hypothetical protein
MACCCRLDDGDVGTGGMRWVGMVMCVLNADDQGQHSQVCLSPIGLV